MASHDRKRLFGVQHAPVFRPTVEEFADPLAYIKSIRHIGLQTGIVKIVPPNTFKPPFCIDKEKFTFKTRLQQLNTLEATTRNANNYAEGLKLFHEQFGTKKFQLPVLDGNSVNLLRLKNTATLLQNVDQQIDWTIVTEALNLNQKSDHRLRKIYENYIIPYEKALKDVQSKPADTRNDETSTCSTVTISSDEESDQVSIKDKGKKPFKRIKFDVIMSKTPEFVKKDTFANPQATMKRASPKIGVVINSNCKVCQKQGYCKDSTVCAQCGSQFHLESVSSNTNAISSNSWTCVTCIKTMGADFGFEEFHQKRGWNEFKTVANRFKLDWCLSRNLKGGCRQTIEKEFWRLVGSIEEKVVVEYGADLHAIDVGSGFPNKASMPNDPYSHNPWNLNNFPTLAGSLFKASANVISGMMVPWVYIGMVFSAFAWHAEDHYTYSINYNHTGAAKTWYGIPESDADKFETTIKNLVPELFESNPDLLFQLTTILSPQTLVDNGVQVFGADQGAGEFIVTFPRGYHSGFNQGFNCAEAVNFAPTDWISIGFECVLNYSKYLKAPVFCHEELLINAALECRDKYDALIFRKELASLHRQERNLVIIATSILNIKPTERIKWNSADESDLCNICKSYCRFSQVECCTHGESFCCLKHVILQQDIELPCGCQSKDWQLRTSFPLDYLHRIQKRLSKLADWGDILDSTIDTSLEPTLEEYRNAYTKAKSNNEPIAFDLKHFLQECTEWIEEVETILSVEKRSLFLDLDIDGQIKRVEQLLDQAAWLPISTPLGSQLVEKYASIVESKFINDQINIPIL